MLCYVLLIVVVALPAALPIPKPPRPIPPLNPDDPPTLPSGVTKKVLIIGGGLAGLSAALELVERGYTVTIKEADSVLGGRLFTVPVQALDKTFSVEHGFHGWFHNYHQFKDIRARLGINQFFKPWGAVHFVFKDYKPEAIISIGPYPFNLIGIIERSPNLKMSDAMLSSLSLPDLVEFNYDVVYEKYDNITFHQWAELRHVEKAFYEIILQPSLSVTLNEPETLSAAEMLTYMQLYFLSDSHADEREITDRDYGSAVIDPWRRHLENLGVNFQLNAPVTGLNLNSSGLVTGEWSSTENHDYYVLASGLLGVKEIVGNTQNKYRSDPVISTLLDRLMSRVDPLQIAPPYKILRVWFNKQLSNQTWNVVETPDFSPVNLVAQYHQLEAEYAQWAQETGGSVLEFHCYTWAYGNTSDDQVWAKISPAVNLIYPEIFERDFKILAYHVNSFENFPSFRFGLNQIRPNSTWPNTAGIGNLFLAGDWLSTSYPSALMERAVSTGREAANQILLADHVRQASMVVTSSYGPGFL